MSPLLILRVQNTLTFLATDDANAGRMLDVGGVDVVSDLLERREVPAQLEALRAFQVRVGTCVIVAAVMCWWCRH